jgi:hypothetical protein
MHNVEVYSDFANQEDFEKELAKMLALESIPHLFVFYLCASYSQFVKEEPILSEIDYMDLCDYLSDNAKNLKDWEEDFKNYTCSLTVIEEEKDYRPGKHYPTYITNLLENIQKNLDIDYRLEVYQELESAN